MDKAFMTIGGVQYRVEVNWNALSNFLVAVGRDTLEGLSQIGTMKPSEITSLMVESIREGERLEGRDCTLTALDLGAVLQPQHVGEFMDIYIRQSHPQTAVEEEPKKEEGQGEQ